MILCGGIIFLMPLVPVRPSAVLLIRFARVDVPTQCDPPPFLSAPIDSGRVSECEADSFRGTLYT